MNAAIALASQIGLELMEQRGHYSLIKISKEGTCTNFSVQCILYEYPLIVGFNGIRCDSVACPAGHYSTNNNGMYPCVECEHNGRLKVLHLGYRMDNHLVYWKGKTGDI